MLPRTDAAPPPTVPPPTPDGRPRARVSQRAVRIAILVLVWVLGSVFFTWTATSSGDPIRLNVPQNDYYNQLTNGFLDGELALPTVPPPALVHLKDPYNPAQNAPWQAEFHDLSLYDGHLYLSWGPAPVVTLLLPWRALGVGAMPENLATLIYSVIGLGFFLALLELLIERYLGRAPPAKVALCALALVGSSVVAYLLRRPLFYELAIACAYCFLGAGLFFLELGRRGGRRRFLWLGLGSLCLGITMGARFEFILVGAIVAAVALEVGLRARRSGATHPFWRAVGVFLPWCVMALLVLAYNDARFHSPFQIGSLYQLAGFDPTKVAYDQLGYVPPSLYYYVFSPPQLIGAFPFVTLGPPPFYPGGTPSAYGTEIFGGILLTTPIVLTILSATYVLRRRLAPLGWIVAALSIVSLAMIGGIAFSVPGGTQRYEADYASMLILAGAITWLAWEPSRRALRRLLTGLGSVAILFGVFVGTATSITGPNDELQTNNPPEYQSLENTFSFVNATAASLAGHAQVVRVIDPLASYPMNLGVYGTYEPGTLRFTFLGQPEEIEINAPATGRYALESRLERTASAPAVGTVTVHISDGTATTATLLRYGRLWRVPVRLQRGLNRIEAWATFTGTQPPGAYPDLVNVYGMRVVRLDARARAAG